MLGVTTIKLTKEIKGKKEIAEIPTCVVVNLGKNSDNLDWRSDKTSHVCALDTAVFV